MRVLVLTALVVVTAATGSNYYRLPNPYSYSCQDSLCVKEERTQVREFRSLGECQITCGEYGSLWPQPTGETHLSQNIVHFNPYNMQVTKIAASNQNVADMLDEQTRYFRRNIHFLHPDFPNNQKTPYTEEQQRTNNVRETTTQQQQFSSNRFSQRTQTENESPEQNSYEAWESYSPFMKQKYSAGIDRQNINIEMTVTSAEERLTLDTDESYNLVVQTLGDQTTVTILATTYFGARHALESLSQLITYDDNNGALMMVQNVRISDKPEYKYRGLMLDTGRNYYTREELMSLLDSMSQNKMNYFHWHITDSASFPLYSNRLPQMAYYGAYSPRKVYYPEDIQQIVTYARRRGINVIPELDAPAHTAAGWQWGEKEGKGNLVLCTNTDLGKEPWFSVSKEPPSGQLNPVNSEVYPILGELYRDILEYFDPEMLHMGGDDVSFKCWQNSNEIKEYFAANNIQPSSREYFELWNTFQSNAYAKLSEASQGRRKVTPIIHSSSFARNYIDKEAYIIQLTEESNDSATADYVNNGFRVIFSNPDQWRLDCAGTNWFGEKAEACPKEIPTWENFYSNSPLDMLYNLGVTNVRSEPLIQNPQQTQQTQQQQSQPLTAVNPREFVLGGTATMWSSETDGNSIQSKVWPRVSAMAERLWSDPASSVNQPFDITQKRLNLQRQRMVDLGIRADPIQPELCQQDESACYSKQQYELRSASIELREASFPEYGKLT